MWRKEEEEEEEGIQHVCGQLNLFRFNKIESKFEVEVGTDEDVDDESKEEQEGRSEKEAVKDTALMTPTPSVRSCYLFLMENNMFGFISYQSCQT